MKEYRKKPVVIQAMQFSTEADQLIAIQDWMQQDLRIDFAVKDHPQMKIETLEGVMSANEGDYIIRGVNGEFYPCKPDIFEKTYESSDPKVKGLSFGEAVVAMKNGRTVAREGWNGKGLFVFMQVPATISKDIVPKMQSLPPAVKEIFAKRFEDPAQQIDAIYYSNQMALVGPSNTVNGWAPSASDALSDDWYIAG